MTWYIMFFTLLRLYTLFPFLFPRVELHCWWDTCYIWKDSLRDWWTGSSFVGHGCSLLTPATDHSTAEPHWVTQEQHTKQRHCHGRSFTSAEGGQWAQIATFVLLLRCWYITTRGRKFLLLLCYIYSFMCKIYYCIIILT